MLIAVIGAFSDVAALTVRELPEPPQPEMTTADEARTKARRRYMTRMKAQPR